MLIRRNSKFKIVLTALTKSPDIQRLRLLNQPVFKDILHSAIIDGTIYLWCRDHHHARAILLRSEKVAKYLSEVDDIQIYAGREFGYHLPNCSFEERRERVKS